MTPREGVMRSRRGAEESSGSEGKREVQTPL